MKNKNKTSGIWTFEQGKNMYLTSENPSTLNENKIPKHI